MSRALEKCEEKYNKQAIKQERENICAFHSESCPVIGLDHRWAQIKFWRQPEDIYSSLDQSISSLLACDP